jgi:hypothetical protein
LIGYGCPSRSMCSIEADRDGLSRRRPSPDAYRLIPLQDHVIAKDLWQNYH